MTDFVLLNKNIYEGYSSQDSNVFTYNHVVRLENYANFLKQPLTLGMFVPCDLEDNVLEEYHNIDNKNILYQEARERVLFGGFVIKNYCSVLFPKTIIYKDIFNVFWYDSNAEKWEVSKYLSTVEDLVEYNLTLTESWRKI